MTNTNQATENESDTPPEPVEHTANQATSEQTSNASSDVSSDRFERAVQELADTAPTKEMEKPNQRILDLAVTIEVVIGSAELTVSQLMALKTGDLVKMEQDISQPMNILVNGSLFARGQLAVLPDQQDRFGVRIIDLLDA